MGIPFGPAQDQVQGFLHPFGDDGQLVCLCEFIDGLDQFRPVASPVQSCPQLFRRHVQAFFEYRQRDLSAFHQDQPQLGQFPVQVLGPDQADGILVIGPQGEVLPDEPLLLFPVQHLFGLTEQGAVQLGTEPEGIGLPGQVGFDLVQGFAVDGRQIFVVFGLYHILQQGKVEIAAIPQDIVGTGPQQPGLQQGLQVVGIHRQQEQTGQFRIRGQFPDPFPGQLELVPDDEIDFSQGDFLFRSHVLSVPGLQQQLHGLLRGGSLRNAPELGCGEQVGGQDTDPAQGIFITGLGHVTSPPRQTEALLRDIPPRSVPLPAAWQKSHRNHRSLPGSAVRRKNPPVHRTGSVCLSCPSVSERH